jgi:CBS domain-containing protein
MRIMELRGFSHVPVVDGEKMLGVFSKSTVFSFHIRNNMPALQRGMRIREFGNLLDIENHSNEYFEFAPKDALYTDILELFNTNYKKRQKRLAIVFLTETGNSQEKLLGLITPWDVLGK